MRNFLAPAALCISIGLLGCQKAAETSEESIEPAANNSPASNAVKVDCPAADAAGNIDIAPGLVATIVIKGYGRAATRDDFADVHTTLWLYDESADGGRGTEVWSSGGEQPFQFQLGSGQVIKGWDMGVPCMLIGETRELIIDGDLAYGPAGRPPIPPDATLIFNIELVNLTSPDQ